MLHLKHNKNIYCPLHGYSCPNKIDANPHSNPHTHYQPAAPKDDDGANINRLLSDDDLLKAINSKCIIASAHARCCVSRRLAITQNNCAHTWEYNKKLENPPIEAMREITNTFNQFINNNLWHIIENAHVRIKLSIVETYAEIQETAGAAIAANSMIRPLRLARMVTDPKQSAIPTPKASDYCKKENIAATCLVAADTARAMLVRLRTLLYSHPALWMIVYGIFEHDLQDKNHIFNTADNIKYQRLYNHGAAPSLASEARSILMPSPMNMKYQHLYRTHHIKHKGYGSASHIPEKDESFLLTNKCVNVMDFGCGKSNRLDTCKFSVVRFDPSIEKYSKPHRDTVDGLISYDVLEHIPMQDLNVFVKWVAIYQPKCIVLGICTRIAGAVLSNGENAHCTVRGSNWWIKWANKSFKSIYCSNIVIKEIKSNRKDYLTLHIRHAGGNWLCHSFDDPISSTS
jgi:hypothetical protein